MWDGLQFDFGNDIYIYIMRMCNIWNVEQQSKHMYKFIYFMAFALSQGRSG